MATIQEALANAIKNKQAEGAAIQVPTPVDNLPEPLRHVRDKLRAIYGERIKAFTDLQVLQTWQDWSLSGEAEDKDSFVEWLNDKYGDKPAVSMAQHEAQEAPGRLSLEEIQRRVAANEITSHEAIELLTEHGHLSDDDEEGSDEDGRVHTVLPEDFSGEAGSDDEDEELSLEEDYIPDGEQTFNEANDELFREAEEVAALLEEESVSATVVSIDELSTAEVETMYQEGMITESERDGFLAIKQAESGDTGSLGEVPADVTDELTKQQIDAMHPVPEQLIPEQRPMLVNPMEDLTQRQTLSVIADHLKTRRQEELFSVLGDILSRVYKMEAVTESDVMVALADNVRLVDFIVAMTREVGVEPSMPKNHVIPINVESSSVIFKPRKTRYNMTDLESAMVNAISRIRSHMKTANKVEGLEQKVKSLESDLRIANMATKSATEAAERATSALVIERQKPAPVPVTLRGKTDAVAVSWITDKVKTNKKTGVKTVTGTTRYYLAVAEGAALNAKGEMPTKLWRRTTDIAESFLFDNVANGSHAIERIKKNAKHLAPESGITDKVMQKMALLTVTTVPV